MNYFDYLRMTNKEDTKDNYIAYLVQIMDYSLKDAKEYADFIYKNTKDDEIELI